MEPQASVFETLAASPLAEFIRESAWAYPILETAHILGIALVMGGIVIFDLRLMGLGRTLPVSALGRHVIPWVAAGILCNVVTGTLLFLSDAAEFSTNVSLRAKLVLIALALFNAVLYQTRAGRDTNAWDRDVMPPRSARVQGALSIALWVGVVTAGRMMAYIK